MRTLLSSKEVAALLGVSEPTLSRWRSSGDGPPVLVVKGIFRYRPESVEQWVKENER
ncbi:helix-turn-helix domain-containing protein [Microbacterium sp. EST19A]|uniref:helix-turn-helix domain-containing protein n=1 Tax=Microbacterium sp. EST19A TaxID=2862681 RepID=UPI001CBAE0E7|nr:helix-turn-helix domain-containing protein [Microbacterium sp. EST19A]